MVIKNLQLKKHKNELKLLAEVFFKSGKRSELFFSIDRKYEKFVSHDASPFLACLLLPAMKLGEDITVQSEISSELLVKIDQIMDLVVSWRLGLKRIKIICPTSSEKPKSLGNVGSFFSGGVDSFTTYLRNKEKKADKITYFIFVHGFDIFLKDQATFDKIYKTIQAIAKEEEIKLISVKTNLREIIDPVLDWGYTHGGAMASIAFLLRKGFKTIYISGTYSAGHLFPWGSHPDLDPLWSVKNLTIIHDSSDISRQQKIKLYISKSPVALKYLRVCWSNYDYNCAKCSKCIRTMLALHMTHALHKSKTFPTKLHPELIRDFYLTSKSQVIFFEELLAELKKTNRDQEIQDAITHMIKRSKSPDMKRRVRSIASYLDKRYNHDRLFWYLAKKGVTTP